MLYLYTTYDSSFFYPISIRSYPMIIEQTRGFCAGGDFQLSVGVELQIVRFSFLKKKKKAS